MDRADSSESRRCTGKPLPAAALTRKGFPAHWQTPFATSFESHPPIGLSSAQQANPDSPIEPSHSDDLLPSYLVEGSVICSILEQVYIQGERHEVNTRFV